MSWLFSQALAEEYSADTSLAGEQFAQLNVMPTPHKFSRNDKTMESSDLSRFGLTCAVLTESHCEELLMSFLADFHARTYQEQVKVQESTEVDLDFGDIWQESSVRYDLDSYSWKTHLCLWEEDLQWSLVTIAKMGFDSEWCCLSASDLGATHQRDRIWITAYTKGEHGKSWNSMVQSENGRAPAQPGGLFSLEAFTGWRGGNSWPEHLPKLRRVADDVAFGVDRIKALGNGQVPRVAAAAFSLLHGKQ